MDISRESLQKRYSEMETHTLLERSYEDLTDLAHEVIDEELKKRNISDNQRIQTKTKLVDETKRIAHRESLKSSRMERWLAAIIDWLIALMLFIPALTGLVVESAVVYVSLIFTAIYLLFSDAFFKGQSIGKYIGGIYVIDEKTNKKCSLGQSFVRNIFRLLGIFDCIFIIGEKKQRLGDRVAGTIVVSTLITDSCNQDDDQQS